jgi:hypothetical protein
MQLVWFIQVNELHSDDGLSKVARYADGIGPIVSMLLSDRSRALAARGTDAGVDGFVGRSLAGHLLTAVQKG